jgi:hypothetical protein
MVVHVCHLSTGRRRQEDHELEASQGDIVRPCLKKTQRQINLKAFWEHVFIIICGLLKHGFGVSLSHGKSCQTDGNRCGEWIMRSLWELDISKAVPNNWQAEFGMAQCRRMQGQNAARLLFLSYWIDWLASGCLQEWCCSCYCCCWLFVCLWV